MECNHIVSPGLWKVSGQMIIIAGFFAGVQIIGAGVVSGTLEAIYPPVGGITGIGDVIDSGDAVQGKTLPRMGIIHAQIAESVCVELRKCGTGIV